MLHKQVYTIILGALYVKHALGIKCYQCNSENDAQCVTVDSRYLKECDPDREQVCRKVLQVVYFTSEPHSTTIRSCGYNYNEMTCEYAPFGKSAKQTVCDCHKDECNKCHRNFAKFGVILLMLLINIYLHFWYIKQYQNGQQIIQGLTDRLLHHRASLDHLQFMRLQYTHMTCDNGPFAFSSKQTVCDFHNNVYIGFQRNSV